MKNSLKLLSAALLMASLVACGGSGDDESPTGEPGTPSGPSGPSGPGTGGGTAPDTTVNYTYHSRDFAGVRQVSIDPEASSGSVTLGSDTFTYQEAGGTTTASAGYSLIGGLDDGDPGVQVCHNGMSKHVVLPVGVQPATIADLQGKTFTWYEDCKVGDGTGPDPLPSSVTIAADGSFEVITPGSTDKDLGTAQDLAALLSPGGLVEGAETTHLYAYKLGAQAVVVFQTNGIIASWVQAPAN